MLDEAQTLASRKAELDARGGAEAFPFDPDRPVADVVHARDLEKLRFVPCRRTAKWLYELYWLSHSNASSEKFQREVEREKRRKRAEHREWVIEMGVQALNGDFGEWLQKSAEGILLDAKGNPKKDDATLEYWEREFRRGRAMEGR